EDLKAPGHLAGVSIDEAWTQNCHRGATCIRNSFSVVDLAYWGGWYFDNGVLSNGERQPACNWGQFANAGVDLRGAERLTFWARGDTGGEKVDFLAGGIGRDAMTGKPIAPHPDSFPRTPPFGHTTTLTNEWQQYGIDLS